MAQHSNARHEQEKGMSGIKLYKIAISKYPLKAKIPPGDPMWPRFNSSFENRECGALEIMDEIYEGHAITTQHKNHWRTVENYICGQSIGLDFDTEDERSSMKVLTSDKLIKKYASFVHTTISHREDAPRARVVFLLDEPIMQPNNYAMAATALLWLFGSADRQCKDAVRFFYGAPGCDMELLAGTLPLDIVKKIIADYKATGLAERKRTMSKDFHAPATQQEVADALQKIPAWGVTYDEWVAILMSLHSEFGEDGYQLAEAWADGKPGEVNQKWRSFKTTGNLTGAVKIGTLFGIAKNYGWSKRGGIIT
jgi:hypothetical protein